MTRTCNGPTPGPELPDGRDNDCDGLTDCADPSCQPATPGALASACHSTAVPFGGRSALQRMLAGNVSDLNFVRRYLDGVRGGGWS